MPTNNKKNDWDWLNWFGPIGTAINTGLNIGNSILGFANYDYQRAMQSQAWNREDQSVQRKVADLREAGLSPTLAAGSSAQTMAPMRIEAPKVPDISQSMNQIVGFSKAMQDLKMTKSQMEMLELQKENQRISNKYADELLSNKVEAGDIANDFANQSFNTRLFMLQEKLSTQEKITLNKDLDNKMAQLKIDDYWMVRARWYTEEAAFVAAGVAGAKRLDQVDKEIAIKQAYLDMAKNEEFRKEVLDSYERGYIKSKTENENAQAEFWKASRKAVAPFW